MLEFRCACIPSRVTYRLHYWAGLPLRRARLGEPLRPKTAAAAGKPRSWTLFGRPWGALRWRPPSLAPVPWAGGLRALPSIGACGGVGCAPASDLLPGSGAPWPAAPRMLGLIGGNCVNLGMLTHWWAP